MIMILFMAFSSLFAAITGSDDRHEILEVPPAIQKLSSSIVALVRKDHLHYLANGKVEISGRDFEEQLGFCPEARFVATQNLTANCSGALVGKNLILTAAHCIEKRGQLNLDEFVAVFDYQVQFVGQNKFWVDASAVYHLKSAPHFDFDFDFPGDNDIALIELDREVLDRKVLEIDFERVSVGEEIFMIGFPFGLPMKYTDNGYVLNGRGMNRTKSVNVTIGVDLSNPKSTTVKLITSTCSDQQLLPLNGLI